MLYHLSPSLEAFWGPFRLLRSHALLLAALTVAFLLPVFFRFSPQDHGKAILGKDGMRSAGKPTGTGLWVTLLLLPIVLLVVPLSVPVLGMVFCLYVAMAFSTIGRRCRGDNSRRGCWMPRSVWEWRSSCGWRWRAGFGSRS